jgi:hypothetical protein
MKVAPTAFGSAGEMSEENHCWNVLSAELSPISASDPRPWRIDFNFCIHCITESILMAYRYSSFLTNHSKKSAKVLNEKKARRFILPSCLLLLRRPSQWADLSSVDGSWRSSQKKGGTTPDSSQKIIPKRRPLFLGLLAWKQKTNAHQVFKGSKLVFYEIVSLKII